MVPAVPTTPTTAGRPRERKTGPRTWPYRLTVEQVAELRELARRIEETCRFVGVPFDPGAAAAGLPADEGVDRRTAQKRASQRRARAVARFAVRDLRDDELEVVAGAPGELRRPTRETLAGYAAGLGLPVAVVDVWCRFCPGAVATTRGTR